MDMNYLAIVVAAVAAFLLGWAWHSPLLFMKPWMRLMKFNSMDDAMHGATVSPMQGMAIGAVVMLVVSYVMAYFISLFGVGTWQAALQLAVWAWLGFMVPIMLNQVLWEKKSWALFGFNAAYQLVSLVLVAVILGAWPWH